MVGEIHIMSRNEPLHMRGKSDSRVVYRYTWSVGISCLAYSRCGQASNYGAWKLWHVTQMNPDKKVDGWIPSE